MRDKNLKYFEAKSEKKAKRRERKKKPKMKVSGARVKNLQRLINK